ncbi:unnamed protein product [Chilo suppressalis]|uniref:Serpin domain-containing protein n=1 Tax=Chilo suppressalis TaxID=168631 RepID=A0ABN8BEP1_CHISP|nr:unnamed protein product [Chilo suppressalis]
MWKWVYIAATFVSYCTGLIFADSSASAYATASAIVSICGKNERSVKCPETLCVPLSCKQAGFPVPCPLVGPGGPCNKPAECICIDGYLRNNKGVCVPKLQCPSCGGDVNARPGCGFQCERRRCDRNILTDSNPCPCDQNGCVCKGGYGYDDVQRKCVLPQQCSKPKENEVFSPCGDFGCDKRNCTQIDQPDICIDPIECFGGYVCIEGYLRAQNGTCIPRDQCYDDLCPKPNEYYDSCPGSCPARTCGIDDRLLDCVPELEPGDPDCPAPACRCERGYYRDNNGNCVVWEDCPGNTTPKVPVKCSDDVLELLQYGNAIFTAKFLYEAYKTSFKKSLIMSPLSVFVPMGELALYSEGETYVQLMKALNLRTKNDIRCVFPTLTNNLKSDKDVILTMAARIFSTDDYPLSQNFLDDTKNVFGAEAESLDFNNAQNAADRINAWVADNTNNRIKNIASPQMFDEYTRLVLANAIFFLGNWVRQFNPNNTENRPFYTANNKSEEIPTMYQESNFKYREDGDLDCKVLEMPYKGGDFSFVVFLPNAVDGLYALIEKLLEPKAFYSAYNATSYRKVNVYLPKIKVESEYNLGDIMQKIGITDIFDGRKSNLTGILQKYEPLNVSTAVQKAFVEVDETGTEAAAANIFIVGTTSAEYPVNNFDANHGFVFYIMYKDMPIFCGTFEN